ncbi:MAG: hypothetical protein H6713_39075 [Myxococcales bacterium]|nr:hypothetical protein [Myxococcales bacterium]
MQSLVLAAVAALASPSGAPAELAINVDTSDIRNGAPIVRKHLERRAAEAAARAELRAEGHALECSIKVLEVNDPEPGYVISLSMRRDGEEVTERARRKSCALCSESELIEVAAQELEALLADAGRRAQAAPAAAPETAPARDPRAIESPPATPAPVTNDEAVTSPEGPIDAPQDDSLAPRRGPLTAAGKTGVGLLVVGAVGLGVGVGLAARAPTLRESNPLEVVDTRPVGSAILATSAVALVAGAVLVGLGRGRRVLTAPVASARQIGWQLHVRF